MSLARRFHRLKKDDEIEQDVRLELEAEQGSTHHLVRVAADRGVVYLTGSADIERAVRSVTGVARIENELLVA